MRCLAFLLAFLALTAPPDPIAQLALNYCLSYRLERLDEACAARLVSLHLQERPGRRLVTRLQQLATLQVYGAAVTSVNRARTAAERSSAAQSAALTLPQEGPGLPMGDLSVVPHLPFGTYLELVEAIYREVAPEPASVDELFASYASSRRDGLDILSSLDRVRPRLEVYRPLVSQALKISVAATGFQEQETQLWGAYLELRWQHEAYLARWEAHVRSLYLLMLTELAELDCRILTDEREDAGARRAGEETGREVARAGADLKTSMELVERRWKSSGRQHYGAFRGGYLAALRGLPGPLFPGLGFTLRVPFGWLLKPTPADLHVVDPDGELQLTVWSYATEPGAGPEAVRGLMDARLRDDGKLTQVAGPFAHGLTGSRWSAGGPGPGLVCEVLALPAGPPPSRTHVVLVGTAPRSRQEELQTVLRRTAASVLPAERRDLAEGQGTLAKNDSGSCWYVSCFASFFSLRRSGPGLR